MFSLTFSCPMYSPSVRGRRESSISPSAGVYSGAAMRFSKSISLSNIPDAPSRYLPPESALSPCLISSSTGVSAAMPASARAASDWL